MAVNPEIARFKQGIQTNRVDRPSFQEVAKQGGEDHPVRVTLGDVARAIREPDVNEKKEQLEIVESQLAERILELIDTTSEYEEDLFDEHAALSLSESQDEKELLVDLSDALVEHVLPRVGLVSQIQIEVQNLYDKLPPIGSPDYFQARERFLHTVIDVKNRVGTRLKILDHYQTSLDERKISKGASAFQSQQDNLTSQRDQVRNDIAYVDLVIEEIQDSEPKQKEVFIAELIWSLAEGYGIKDRLPTPREFSELVQEKIALWADDMTEENFGYAEFNFLSGHEAHGYSLIDLYEDLSTEISPKRIELKQYLGVYGEIFAYATWRKDSRKMRTAVMDNYHDPKALSQALFNIANYNTDAGPLKTYAKMLVPKDKFESTTPFAERARAASIIYEKAYVIHLIQNYPNPGISDSYFLERYKVQASSDSNHQTELLRSARKTNISSVTKAEVLLFERAYVLRSQPDLEFLTQDEAEFLIKNMRDMFPIERTTDEKQAIARRTIQLFCSVGPIRKDDKRGGTEKALGRKYLTKDFEIKMVNGSIVYLKGGRSITDRRELDELNKMQKYGARAEGGAYDMAWATFQALMADAGFVWAFNKSLVPLMHPLVYAERYVASNYVGLDRHMYKITPRLLSSWLSQTFVEEPGKPVMSLVNLFGSPEVDMTTDGVEHFRRHIPRVEEVRQADNLNRAIDMANLLKDGIFTSIGVRFSQFHDMEKKSGEAEELRKKIGDGFRAVLKKIKYFRTMHIWQDENVLKTLVGDAKVRKSILTELQNGNEKEAGDLFDKNVFLAILEESLVREFRSRNIDPELNQELKERTLLLDSNTRQDARALVHSLIGGGRIKTAGVMKEVVDSLGTVTHIKEGVGLFKGSGEHVFIDDAESDVYKGPIGRKILRAALKAIDAQQSVVPSFKDIKGVSVQNTPRHIIAANHHERTSAYGFDVVDPLFEEAENSMYSKIQKRMF